MRIVGLTGGIGSGKSTIARMFRELGIPVYDSDEEAKKLMVDSPKVKSAIMDLLGAESYVDGKLNRYYVASKVFVNPDLLLSLNEIVHPAVREHFNLWVKNQESPYVIQETALIYENGVQEQYDAVILVVAPKEIRLKRVMDRDNVDSKKVQDRMDNQMDDSLKKDLAQHVITNLDLESTRRQVSDLHRVLVKAEN